MIIYYTYAAVTWDTTCTSGASRLNVRSTAQAWSEVLRHDLCTWLKQRVENKFSIDSSRTSIHFPNLLGPGGLRRLSRYLLDGGGNHPGQVASLSQSPWSWSDTPSSHLVDGIASAATQGLAEPSNHATQAAGPWDLMAGCPAEGESPRVLSDLW